MPVSYRPSGYRPRRKLRAPVRRRAPVYSARKRAPVRRAVARSAPSIARQVANGVASAMGSVLGGSAGKAALKYGAKGLGYLAGGPLGSYAADLGSAAFSKITGMGDYHIKSNSLMSEQVPFMHATKGGGCRIRHREFIQNITGSTSTFAVATNLPVQPGLSTSFAWLSNIAVNYQNWKAHGVAYEFKSTSADALVNGTNTALGVVIGAVQYNSLNGPFTSKQAMENCQYSCSCKPSESMLIPIECDPAMLPVSELYVRSGAVPSNGDQRLYDLGELTIGVSSMPGSNVVGELWVSYDIEFMSPIQGQNNSDLLQAHYSFNGATATYPFGVTSALEFDNIGLSLSATNASSFTIPAGYDGEWMYIWINRGASTASLVAPTITLTNAMGSNLFNNDASSTASSIIATASLASNQFVCNSFTITDSAIATVVAFSSGTLNTTPTYGDLFVFQLNTFMVL